MGAEHTGSAMKHAVSVSHVLKYRAAAAGGGLLIAYNSLPSLCAEVNDRRHGPTGNRDETFQQMFVKLAQKELEQDPQVRSEESQAEAWTALGVAGGATVEGVHYSGKQCFDKAVKLNAKSPATWTHLGIEQGAAPKLEHTPQQTADQYSQTQCFEKALELDPTYLYAWTYLGVSGGGTIGGVSYSKKQCHQKAAELVESGWVQQHGARTDEGGIVTANDPDISRPDGGIAWTLLALEGGGLVHGVEYSEKQCHQKALFASEMSSAAGNFCSIQ